MTADCPSQLAEELGRIFRHYCAGGYVSFDVLPAENFYKFVRDCHMLDNLLTHDDMQVSQTALHMCGPVAVVRVPVDCEGAR